MHRSAPTVAMFRLKWRRLSGAAYRVHRSEGTRYRPDRGQFSRAQLPACRVRLEAAKRRRSPVIVALRPQCCATVARAGRGTVATNQVGEGVSWPADDEGAGPPVALRPDLPLRPSPPERVLFAPACRRPLSAHSQQAAERVAFKRVTEFEILLEHGVALVPSELLEAGGMHAAVHAGGEGAALEAVAPERGPLEAGGRGAGLDDARDGARVDGGRAEPGWGRGAVATAG